MPDSNQPGVEIALSIDGEQRRARVDPRSVLVDALRDDFGATAPKVGCRTGDCGACTVRLDDELTKSCLVLTVAAADSEVGTISGLADGDRVDEVQEAFWNANAFQCGFCLSGMLLAAEDLLERNPDPGEAEIRAAISGNLCRCTGYDPIVDAVLHAAQARQLARKPPDA